MLYLGLVIAGLVVAVVAEALAKGRILLGYGLILVCVALLLGHLHL